MKWKLPQIFWKLLSLPGRGVSAVSVRFRKYMPMTSRAEREYDAMVSEHLREFRERLRRQRAEEIEMMEGAADGTPCDIELSRILHKHHPSFDGVRFRRVEWEVGIERADGITHWFPLHRASQSAELALKRAIFQRNVDSRQPE